MNLIICMTPLQALIARHIIKMYSDKDFIGLYLTYIDNDKQRHYYKILSEVCKKKLIFRNKKFYKNTDGKQFFDNKKKIKGTRDL